MKVQVISVTGNKSIAKLDKASGILEFETTGEISCLSYEKSMGKTIVTVKEIESDPIPEPEPETPEEEPVSLMPQSKSAKKAKKKG